MTAVSHEGQEASGMLSLLKIVLVVFFIIYMYTCTYIHIYIYRYNYICMRIDM